MSATVRSRFDTNFIPGGSNAVPEDRYRFALRQLALIRDAMRSHFQSNRLDAIVFPPTMTPALPIGTEGAITIAGTASKVRTAMLRNTVHASCVGMPGLVLPAGLTKDGLPVGLEIDTLPGEDRNLLALGLSVQRELGQIASPAESIAKGRPFG